MVEPVDKKRKVAVAAKPRQSRIFSPFRVLGNVSNETPFALGTLGLTFYVVTSVGRLFQIYDVANLHLLFVSQSQTPAKITSLAAHHHYVFCGFQNKVGVYKRGILQHTLICPNEEIITHLSIFGDFLVVANSKNHLFVYKKNGEKYPTELHSSIFNIAGKIVGIIHPPTYINKIAVATTSHIYIVNVNSGKVIYESTDDQFDNEPITAIEYAPVLDLVAVGTAHGGVYIYNLRKGKVVGNRIMASGKETKVVSLSFRTDGSSHLVAGLSNGDLFFYDLEKGARIHILKGAHKESYGGVANVKFLNGQSILVSNGGDNSLKEYVFDPTISTTNTSIVSPPRHLRSRGGHSAPPTHIEFPQENKSHFILSASRDRSFWSFSLRKDAQSQEFSQRGAKVKDGKRLTSMREKFPEIVSISSNQNRQGDWENIITAHKDDTFARTWDGANKRVGRHQLNTVDGGTVSSVCISHCGNFALVGSNNGGIGSYNLQSGLLRKKYMLHKSPVTGICMDGMNQKLVSGGLDGIIGFYNFTKLTYLGKLDLELPITLMIYHKSSDLVAVALDDLSIVVIDVVTQKVVRILYGHSNRVTGMDFSPDGRWIVSVSLDGTLRTWDLPTGGCIDGVWLPSVATSVKFSPIGDLVATTHVTGNGIFLWTNKAQFRPVSTRQIEEDEFANTLLPNSAGDGGATLIDGALEEAESAEDRAEAELEQIDTSLVTLSLGSRTKYSQLMHLDVIKQRSRPKEAPKKPKNAPFFLSLKGEVVGDRAIEAENGYSKIHGAMQEQQGEEEEDSRLMKFKNDGSYNFESKFTTLLREGADQMDYSQFIAFVVELPPSAVDLEIRSLNAFPPLDEMTRFVEALTQGLEKRTNYDILHSLYAMFLKCHGDVIYANKEDELYAAMDQFVLASKDIDHAVKYVAGVVDLISTV